MRQTEHSRYAVDCVGVLAEQRKLVDRTEEHGRSAPVDVAVDKQERKRLRTRRGFMRPAPGAILSTSADNTELMVPLWEQPQACGRSAEWTCRQLVPGVAGREVRPIALGWVCKTTLL